MVLHWEKEHPLGQPPALQVLEKPPKKTSCIAGAKNMKNIAVPRLSVIGAAKQSQCYFYFHVFIFIHEENGLSGGWKFLRESGHL